MKISRYVVSVRLSDNERLLYNTINKQYFLYHNSEEAEINGLLQNLNKGEYSGSEIEILQQLVQKKIALADTADELDELMYLENQIRFQSDTFHIMIIVTNACNFRCSYCIQEHERIALSDSSAEKILALISERSKNVKRVNITWFGGEPLLQYTRIRQIMRKAGEICEKNQCMIEAGMISNGYLLTQDIIAELKGLHVNMLQITLDGDKDSHNERRFLANGDGTYDVVVKNILMVAEAGINLILRINVDYDNLEKACVVLETIPEVYRENVTISVANLYQTTEKVSPYQIYKKAIEMGFRYKMRNSVFMACQVCLMNGIVVDANGRIVVCANAEPKEKELGYIGNNGEMVIQNTALYYKLKTVSALQNPECRECRELPFCIATCKYRRSIDNQHCIGKRNDGLTVEERAKLDYFYDRQKES